MRNSATNLLRYRLLLRSSKIANRYAAKSALTASPLLSRLFMIEPLYDKYFHGH
jgi:hypothetical protein